MKKKELAPAEARHRQYYRDLCWMAVPLLCMSVYYYGLRPLLLCLLGLVTGNLCDRLVARLRRRPYVTDDYSNESFGLVIALLLPASVDWYVLVAAVLAGVLIGKEAFGGYGSYPFHPAAVGYVLAAVSWPEQVFSYPQPHTMLPLFDDSGVTLVSGISGTLKAGGLPSTHTMDLLLGDYAGPMGATAALVLASCALFLLVRGDINWETPLCFLAVCAAIAFFFPRQGTLEGLSLMATVPERLNIVKYELLSGAILFSTVFLLCEPFTCPTRYRGGRALYGALLGAVTMGFRYFGVYETGVCFALLIVNSVSEWLDRFVDGLYAARRSKGGAPDEA